MKVKIIVLIVQNVLQIHILIKIFVNVIMILSVKIMNGVINVMTNMKVFLDVILQKVVVIPLIQIIN